MSRTLAAVRGMNDLVPEATATWQQVERELRETLKADKVVSGDEAILEIYRRLRPGDPPTAANARALIKRLFFDPKRYDLGDVGRYRINRRLDVGIPFESTVLHLEDFLAIIRYRFRD